MRWHKTEYLLKGIFLGLLLFAALQEPDWENTGRVALCLVGGLAAGLLVGAVNWLRRGIRVRGRVLSFLLFLLLESPTLVYAGLVGGMLVGALMVRDPGRNDLLLPLCVGGGAVLGYGFGELRYVTNRYARLGVALAVCGGLAALGIWYVLEHPEVQFDRRMFGVHLLLGLPFFYLLTFAGAAEESEAEIAALCGAMAAGVWLIELTPTFPAIGVLIPLVLYYLYSTNVLPGLRIFKHTLRGHSYAQMGRTKAAIRSLRRAVELQPNNALALHELARIHRDLDLDKLSNDPELVAMLDLDLCVNRAAQLLWQGTLSTDQLDEVRRLLDLVANQRPARKAEADYWRAIAAMRAKQPEKAAALLDGLLDPAAWPAGDPARRSVLLPAWQLALLRSPDLAARAGQPQLAQPGRKLEAIAAVERVLAATPKDEDAWELKRTVYDKLGEDEYDAAPPKEGEFDHAFVRERGLALLDDPARWRRGIEFVRLAARGLAFQRPGLFARIAQTFERANEAEPARQALEAVKTSGREAGPANLPPEEKQVYFATVKRLGDEAMAKGDTRAAIENYTLYAESDRSGLETLRTLAELYERSGDALAALRFTDRALVYDSKDPDLLARKDRYYFSVTPEQVQAAPEQIRTGMDFAYCVNKAANVLNSRGVDLDAVEWAGHLADVARVLKPDSFVPKVLAARALLWRGERDAAVKLLEEVKGAKGEKFASGDEEAAWFRSCQLLGDLYLNDLARPDLAVPCFLEFRTSVKSGADTIYKLGQAYEQLGDAARAAKCYEQVTAYEGHPRYYDAQEGLRRVKG